MPYTITLCKNLQKLPPSSLHSSLRITTEVQPVNSPHPAKKKKKKEKVGALGKDEEYIIIGKLPSHQKLSLALCRAMNKAQ